MVPVGNNMLERNSVLFVVIVVLAGCPPANGEPIKLSSAM